VEEEIKSAFIKVNVALIPGKRGIFDINLDGKLIFSKFTTKRFPNPKEVIQLIQKNSQS